jgi:simple sugar transport system ATP-binding protein
MPEALMRDSGALVEASGLTKRFGQTLALSDVSIAIEPHSSTGLVGRNGAGKSTLVSLLTGMTSPDTGTIRFSGTPAPNIRNRMAWRDRVACLYQRSTIVPELSVGENLFLNDQSRRPWINWKQLHLRAQEVLDRYELGVRSRDLAGQLDVESRQMLEIARALSRGTRFIILDEPTAKLDGVGVGRLFERMAKLKEDGVTFLYISHHLQEVFEVCSSVIVLRDGQVTLSASTAEVSREVLIEAMTGDGRPVSSVLSSATPTTLGETVLRVRGLSRVNAFQNLSFEVRAGEIVGFVGSASSGAMEMGRCLSGLSAYVEGDILVGNQTVKTGSVPDFIEKGVGSVPQDRQREGFVASMSIADNITLPASKRLGRFGLISATKSQMLVEGLVEQLDVKASSIGEPVSGLSGGNQQKVVLGRALSTSPKVLVLMNPTVGVDIKSKAALMDAIVDTARRGTAVVLITEDVEDLEPCRYVYVLFRGQVTHRFESGWKESDLVAAVEGLKGERIDEDSF